MDCFVLYKVCKGWKYVCAINSVLENDQKFIKWTQMTFVSIFIIEKVSRLFFIFGFLKLGYFSNVILKNRSLWLWVIVITINLGQKLTLNPLHGGLGFFCKHYWWSEIWRSDTAEIESHWSDQTAKNRH